MTTSKSNDEILEQFAEVIAESRDSGLASLENYSRGWRPKKPDSRETALISLIERLDDVERGQLREAVAYCIDLSFFKLLGSLEEGNNGLTFGLVAKNESSADAMELVGDNQDHGLRQKYWKWVK